jgi:hypothetical protein
MNTEGLQYFSGPGYDGSQQPHPPPGPGPAGAQEEDRGLMGALAGGAAGFAGGHKMGNHGIIGALAGAFMGSKLEDYAKVGLHYSIPVR